MALHSTAQGLATLGRHGDSVLVHMQPQEVAGLQALAQSQGTSLTVNPNTGMPEAFNLGNFFSSLLPTLVGAALAPATGGASLGLTGMAATAAPIVGGMATGALVAGAKGEDVLGGALMGGLGGYGGGNLGNSLSSLGGGVNPATSNIQLSTLANGGGSAGIPTSALNSGITNTNSLMGLGGTASTAAPTQGVQLATNTMNLNPLLSDQFATSLTPELSTAVAAGQPVSTIGSGAKGGFDSMMLGAGKFASDPIGQFDAFKAAGGSGMQLAPIGIAGLSAMQPEPYDFAADEAKRKAEENKYRDPITGKLNLSASSGLNLTGFAMGGQVDLNPSVGGGLSDLYNRPEGATTQSISSDGYGMGRLDRLAQQGSLSKAGDTFYAGGGPVSFAEGGDKGMNIEGLGSLNVNTGMQSGAGMGAGMGDGLNKTFSDLMFESMYRGMGPETVRKMMGMSKSVTQNVPKSYALNVNSGQQEAQYAQGGYLNGAGDGMSDSIPATIEGKQPARLADGEFVVPADVVSHLGNGSSKAGSKKLYAMLDKVRHARTGNKKQGREINPAKYMPA